MKCSNKLIPTSISYYEGKRDYVLGRVVVSFIEKTVTEERVEKEE